MQTWVFCRLGAQLVTASVCKRNTIQQSNSSSELSRLVSPSLMPTRCLVMSTCWRKSWTAQCRASDRQSGQIPDITMLGKLTLFIQGTFGLCSRLSNSGALRDSYRFVYASQCVTYSHENLVLSNDLRKDRLPPWKILKAGVSSVSPSSERIDLR